MFSQSDLTVCQPPEPHSEIPPLHIYIVFICSHRVTLQYVSPQNLTIKYPLYTLSLYVITEWPYSMSAPWTPQWDTPLHIYIVFICSHRVTLQYVNPQKPIMKYPSTHCVYMFSQSDLTVCQPPETHNEIPPLHIVFICSHRVTLQYVNPQKTTMKYPATHCVYMFSQSDLTVCQPPETHNEIPPLHIVFICSHRVTLQYVNPQKPIMKYPATHCVYMFSQSDLTVCQLPETHNEIPLYTFTLCLYVLTEWPYSMSTPWTPQWNTPLHIPEKQKDHVIDLQEVTSCFRM